VQPKAQCAVCFPETQQADNFTPPAALFAKGLNFGTPVLGAGALTPTTVSFTAFDPHRLRSTCSNGTARYRRALGRIPSVEVGYLSSRGFHLQRAHLINNTLTRTWSTWTAPAVQDANLRAKHHVARSSTDAVIQARLFRSAHQPAGEQRAELVRRGYINVRRRYAHGLSFLANYTLART